MFLNHFTITEIRIPRIHPASSFPCLPTPVLPSTRPCYLQSPNKQISCSRAPPYHRPQKAPSSPLSHSHQFRKLGKAQLHISPTHHDRNRNRKKERHHEHLYLLRSRINYHRPPLHPLQRQSRRAASAVHSATVAELQIPGRDRDIYSSCESRHSIRSTTTSTESLPHHPRTPSPCPTSSPATPSLTTPYDVPLPPKHVPLHPSPPLPHRLPISNQNLLPPPRPPHPPRQKSQPRRFRTLQSPQRRLRRPF